MGGSATTCSSPKQHQKEEKQASRPLLILVATNTRPSRQLTPISEMNRSFNFLALVLAAACMLGDTEAFAPRPVTASSRNPVSLQACRKIKDDDVPKKQIRRSARGSRLLPRLLLLLSGSPIRMSSIDSFPASRNRRLPPLLQRLDNHRVDHLGCWTR